MGKDDGYDGLGEYDPSEDIKPQREVVVGDPQIKLKEKERSVTSILKELAAIQQQGTLQELFGFSSFGNSGKGKTSSTNY